MFRLFLARGVAYLQHLIYICIVNQSRLIMCNPFNEEYGEFSYFSAPITNVTANRCISVHSMYRYIVSVYKRDETARIQAETDGNIRRNLKRTLLDYVTPGCMVHRRAVSELVRPSGLMVLDLDHVVGDDLSPLNARWEVRKRTEPLWNCFTSVLGFVSPSGRGYKLVIDISRPLMWLSGLSLSAPVYDAEQVRTFAEAYSRIFANIRETAEKAGFELDKSGSDIVRACYLCHDPYARINADYLERG